MGAGNMLYISDPSCACDAPETPGHVRVLQIATGIITTIV